MQIMNWPGLLSIITGLILVSISTFGLVLLARFRGAVSNVLAFAIAAYATIVLLAQVLSELHAVNPFGFLIGHLIIVLLVLPWSWKLYPSGLAAVSSYCSDRKVRFKKFARETPVLTLFGLLVSAALLLGVYLIIIVRPNIYDSLYYHLTRVAYWLQNGTLHHFQTPDPIKTAQQGYNAEIGLLWLTALWRTDRLTGFVQWFATIFAMLAIYGLARRLKFPRPASLFAALVWSTFTVVVLQSTSTKNDTLLAFFVVASYYFLVCGLQDSERHYAPHLLWFGLSYGLAVGTKTTAMLILPGLIIGCGWLLLSNPSRFFQKLLYAALLSGFGIILVGSYNSTLNWLDYRSPFGPPELYEEHAVENPSITTFETNLARIVYHFFDPGGLPTPVVEAVQQWRPQAGQAMFSALHIAPNLPQANLDTFKFDDLRQITPREDAAWYGPLGFLLFLPVLFYYVFVSPFVEKNFWRWLTAFLSFSFIIVFALLLRWQLHLGRFMLIPVTIGAPLLAGFYLWSARNKILRWAVILVALVVLGWSATHNYLKPLFGPGNIWDLDYYQLRAIQKPRLAMAHRYLDEQIPEETHLGIAGEEIITLWEYLFFGPNLKRHVVYLGPELERIELSTFTDNDIEYLVYGSYPPHTIESQAPLWPVIKEKGLEWFLVKREEMEVFTVQPTRPEIYYEAFGNDYLAYREIIATLDQEEGPIQVLTTDPRMPFYDLDERFVFGLPDDLDGLEGFTHLIVAPWWSTSDYERFDTSLEDVQHFLGEEIFVKKINDSNGYGLYRILF